MRRPLIAGLPMAVTAVLLAAGCSDSPAASPATPTSSPTRSSAATAPAGPVAAPPSLRLPADASQAAAAAGLPMLGEEHLAVHYHAHLDLIVAGDPIAVPAGIGIDQQRHKIAPLHTHERDGVVHIESATDVPFTLGQLFTAWGHPISATGIGDYRVPDGSQLRVYRNGTQQAGDPAAFVFKAHDEVVVWVGPANETPSVPGEYSFPPGE